MMVTIWFRRSSQKVALGMCFQVEPQYDEGLDVRESEKEMNEE